MPTLYRTLTLNLLLFIILPQAAYTANDTQPFSKSLPQLTRIKTDFGNLGPANPLTHFGPIEAECYQLQDLYKPEIHESPTSKIAQLIALLTTTVNSYLPKHFQPKYTLQRDPNFPLLSCFSKKLTSEQIIQDIVNLRLFNSSKADTSQRVYFFSPYEKPSFFDQTKRYPVWKTYEHPRSTRVEKITNKSITDWYILGDRHGDGVSLDVLFAFLQENNLCNAQGELKEDVGIILLGDYIDRGVDSPGVLHRIVQAKKNNMKNIYALRGNHEEGECGNGLQESLSIFGEKTMKELHHWYITSLCQLPNAFFLQVPNKESKTPNFLYLVHGGIDSFQMEPKIYKHNIRQLQNLLESNQTWHTSLKYPHKVRRSTLWGDYIDEEDSVDFGAHRKFGLGKKDTEKFLSDLRKDGKYYVVEVVRAHQQKPKDKFSDITSVPGVGTYFPIKPGTSPKNIKDCLVATLNVAPRTALATAKQYEGLFQVKYDTVLHIHSDWQAGTWNSETIHFDGTTGAVVPSEKLQF